MGSGTHSPGHHHQLSRPQYPWHHVGQDRGRSGPYQPGRPYRRPVQRPKQETVSGHQHGVHDRVWPFPDVLGQTLR